MNEIVNTFLLAGDKFISEIHLRQPGFMYSACSACGPYKKTDQESKSLKKQEINDIFVKKN